MDFKEIYELYFKDVYRFLLGLSRDEPLAEDLCPGFDLAQCQVLKGIYSVYVNDDSDDNIFLRNEGDPDFDQLPEKIRGYTFRRSFRNLAPDILYD